MGKQSREGKQREDSRIPAPTAEGEQAVREAFARLEANGRDRPLRLGGKKPTPKGEE